MPPTSWSWYADSTNPSYYQQLGCNQANYDKATGWNSTVVLDFGAYNYSNNSADGTAQDMWGAHWQTQGEIQYLAENFLWGWYSCHPGPIMFLDVGGNNSITMDYSTGVNSAVTELGVKDYAAQLNDPFVGGSEDLETWSSWSITPGQAYNWFNGWNARGGNGYDNIGSADGCPTSGGWGCSYGWNMGDYYNFSQGWWQSHVAPETYYNNLAAQWNNIRNSTNGGNGKLLPQGPLNQPNGAGNNPSQAWAALSQYFSPMYYSMEIHWMNCC